MSASQYILSIDLGTGGPKVALVAPDGGIVSSAVRSVSTRHLGPGAAEQDPDEVWRAIVSAAKQVVHESDQPSASILGIACTGHYFSIVPIDELGRPVGNMIPWMDERGAPHTLETYARHPESLVRWIEIAGMPPLPSGNDSLSHMLFLKNERPEVYERAHKLVEPADYITARLTGVCSTNPCTAFAQLLTDNRKLDAVAYHDDLIRFSGIDREKLPDLIPEGACIGPVRKEIAEEIGVAVGTKVFAGVNDTQAASIGTGVFRDGYGGINVGTTCQVLAFVGGMRADLERGILSMPSPIRDRYMVMAEVGLGGKPLEHFLTQVAFADDALGDHSATDPFANVEKTVASVPPGSGGLLYLPWLSGSQSPRMSPSMRGGFLNFTLETTRARMVRAVLEGVTFSLRWALPAVERFIENEFDELQFSGGGARSAEWTQIVADVMDRPVHQLAEPRHVNNRATALLAFEQLGLASLDDIETLCRIERTHEPIAENRDVYARLFEQFVAAYEQNLPIFEALNG